MDEAALLSFVLVAGLPIPLKGELLDPSGRAVPLEGEVSWVVWESAPRDIFSPLSSELPVRASTSQICRCVWMKATRCLA